MGKTSHGPKLLGWNSSYESSCEKPPKMCGSKSTVITEELWKDGGLAGAGITKPMKFSNEYTPFSDYMELQATQDTSLAHPIQPMAHPEAFSQALANSSLLWKFPMNSSPSSLILTTQNTDFATGPAFIETFVQQQAPVLIKPNKRDIAFHPLSLTPKPGNSLKTRLCGSIFRCPNSPTPITHSAFKPSTPLPYLSNLTP